MPNTLRAGCPPCAAVPSLDPPCRHHQLLLEMILRLDDAVLAGTPRFALQRLLSDLVVYTSLHLRQHNPCPIEDAEFLHRISTLEIAYARNQLLLSPQHTSDIKSWFHDHTSSSSSCPPAISDAPPLPCASY